MTISSDTPHYLRTNTDVTPLRAKWGWIVALGVVYVIAGFIATLASAMKPAIT